MSRAHRVAVSLWHIKPLANNALGLHVDLLLVLAFYARQLRFKGSAKLAYRLVQAICGVWITYAEQFAWPYLERLCRQVCFPHCFAVLHETSQDPWCHLNTTGR